MRFRSRLSFDVPSVNCISCNSCEVDLDLGASRSQCCFACCSAATDEAVMATQVAEGRWVGEGGGGQKEGVPPPQVKIDQPTQSLHPPTKESLSSAGSTSSASGVGADLAPRKVLKGKPKPLYFWTSADVNKWWRKHGGLCYQLYGDLLTEHDVGGRTLIRMNEIKLEKIGITNVEHRHELMQHILRLRLKHEMADLKNLDQRGVGFDLKLPDPRPAGGSADKTDKTEKSSGSGAPAR